MSLVWLDHVNIRTARLDEMRRFYTDILGLDDGQRPDFGFDGAWLYLGDKACVHLVPAEKTPAARDPGIEHFAFRSLGAADMIRKLQRRGIGFNVLPRIKLGVLQINLWDPDGNHIELAYPPREIATLPKKYQTEGKPVAYEPPRQRAA
jgi:catechol 2,3-dioxygenase-like lactoylglutathione lyase family enzyme